MAVDRTLYARISSALQTGQPTRVIDDNCANLMAVEGTSQGMEEENNEE